MLKKVLTIFLFAVFSIFSFGADKLKVGVTLQPYYSFVTNIAGDKVDVFPVPLGAEKIITLFGEIDSTKSVSFFIIFFLLLL